MLIFTNKKDPTIEKWLLKIQNKLKLNQKHYLDNNTQIYYAKNCYRDEVLEHLQLHLHINLLIPFEIVDNLFTKLEKVYGNSHCKKYAIEKFRELKMGSRSFNAFYSKFIKLAAKLKFTKKMLLPEFIHKLFPHMQDQINFRLKYPNNIKNLVICCQKIYD